MWWHLWHEGRVLLWTKTGFVFASRRQILLCFLSEPVNSSLSLRDFLGWKSRGSYRSWAPPGTLLCTPERWMTKASSRPGLGCVQSKTLLLSSPWEKESLPDKEHEKGSRVSFLWVLKLGFNFWKYSKIFPFLKFYDGLQKAKHLKSQWWGRV